jgi:hypothetical protein
MVPGERLAEMAPGATIVGFYTFLVFSVAAFAQLVVGYLLIIIRCEPFSPG